MSRDAEKKRAWDRSRYATDKYRERNRARMRAYRATHPQWRMREMFRQTARMRRLAIARIGEELADVA